MLETSVTKHPTRITHYTNKYNNNEINSQKALAHAFFKRDFQHNTAHKQKALLTRAYAVKPIDGDNTSLLKVHLENCLLSPLF